MPVEVEVSKNRQGKRVYRVRARVRKGSFQRSQTKTFNDKRLGLTWGNRKEEEFLNEYELIQTGQPPKPQGPDLTLSEYLQKLLDYMDTIPEQDRYRKEDIACLKRWQKTQLGEIKSSEPAKLEEALFTRFEYRVREERISPATNHSDLCVLERAIKWQKRLRMPFCRFVTDEVKSELWETGLTGKSRHKNVRPTEEQVLTLYGHFLERDRHPKSTINYRYMMLFAIYSTFRLSEICRLKWSLYNPDTGEIIIEDRKDPKNKWGNHEKVPLHDECIKLITKQPRREGEDRIFPYKSSSVSTKFNTTTGRLDMPEIDFHSLRHEGISRLFEQGYTIPQVAIHSGHKNWNNLRRYTHLIHKNVPDLYTTCMDLEKEYNEKLIQSLATGE